MSLQESGEMYLETILILTKKNPSVRAIDVAGYMNYSKPSVSRAMGILKNEGYIVIEETGSIALTPKGREIANIILERHNVISGLLMRLGVSKETAMQDACRIEHYISEETFLAIKKHIEKYD